MKEYKIYANNTVAHQLKYQAKIAFKTQGKMHTW